MNAPPIQDFPEYIALLELIYPLGFSDAVNMHVDQTLEDYEEDLIQIWNYLPAVIKERLIQPEV